MSPNGETSPGVCDQGRLQLTTPCLGSARGGNEVWQRTSMKHSAQGLCGRDCTLTSRRSSVPKGARWQAHHSAPSHCPVRLGSNPRSSVCCSSDVSGALCPCPRQVDVAVHSMQVATTAQLVRTLPWRALQHASAERPGGTSEHRIWTCLLEPEPTIADWKWWLMDSACSTALSWRSTPRWCPRCVWTVLRASNAQQLTGLPWPKPAFGQSAPTPNLLRHTVGHAWWWWLAKSAAGGRTRPSRSSTRWQTLRCGMSQRNSRKWSRPRG